MASLKAFISKILPGDSLADIAGWEAYCEECGTFRRARRCEERDANTGEPYSEIVCSVCSTILLTFQRAGMTRLVKALGEQPAGDQLN